MEYDTLISAGETSVNGDYIVICIDSNLEVIRDQSNSLNTLSNKKVAGIMGIEYPSLTKKYISDLLVSIPIIYSTINIPEFINITLYNNNMELFSSLPNLIIPSFYIIFRITIE